MMPEFTVVIQHEPSRFGRSLWIYRRNPNGDLCVLQADGEEKIYPFNTNTPATMYIDENIFRKLVEAISTSGVPIPEKKYLEGKVEAQSEHLKDLRKLLKL